MGILGNFQTAIKQLPDEATLDEILLLTELVEIKPTLREDSFNQMRSFILNHSQLTLGWARGWFTTTMSEETGKRLQFLRQFGADKELPVFLAICFMSCPD